MTKQPADDYRPSPPNLVSQVPTNIAYESGILGLCDQLRSGEKLGNSSFPANWFQEPTRLPRIDIFPGKPGTDNESSSRSHHSKSPAEKFSCVEDMFRTFNCHRNIETFGQELCR